MVVLYFVVRTLILCLHVFARRRATTTEGRYVEVTAEVEKTLAEPAAPAGAKSPATAAIEAMRRSRKEGVLAARCESAEAAAHRWAGWSEWLGRVRGAVSGYKGRTLPYLIGHAELALAWMFSEEIQVAYEMVRSLCGY